MARIWVLFGLLGVAVAWETGVFSPLRTAVQAGKQPDGTYLLPTSQILRPWGLQTPIAGRPVDMAFDGQRRILAVLEAKRVLLLDAASGATTGSMPSRATSYSGIAFRPGTRELWASEARRNGPDSILVASVSAAGAPQDIARISLRGHPVPTGIAFSGDGNFAYVAFSRNNSVAVLDARERQVVREIPVGVAPFGVAVSHGKLFVTNRGGRRPVTGEASAPSSGTAVLTDSSTGSSRTGTVSVVDLDTYATLDVSVGLAPSGIAVSPGGSLIAVANGHSDSISLIAADSRTVQEVSIPAWPQSSLGSQPIGVVFDPDGGAIYVACAGTNAVAVVRRHGSAWMVDGAVPTGWFPSAVAIDAAGALRVLSIKGIGNTARKLGGFNSVQYEGGLNVIPVPNDPQLAAGTREVRAANTPDFEPLRGVSNLPALGIEHVLFIVKENRTYDQVFGDMGKGNSDARYLMYGRDITPNHHALAEQYVLLDNFYTSGAISFDGHHWLMQAFVSDYVERAFASSPRGYAWDMADALVVAPTGFFWQGAPKTPWVRIYGEFCLPAKWDAATKSSIDMNERDELPWSEYWRLYKEGKWQPAVGCAPGVPALKELHDLRFPHSTTEMTDQIRADAFLRALAEFEQAGRMPNIMILDLESDHTNGTNPGSPVPRAMVADNDLALGRVVEGMSKSKFWAKSLILVVEDDAQDGVDHVDGHRTVALAVGPNVRRGVVDSNFYTHLSMVRTIQDIFGIPARTRFVKAARPMRSVFTATATAEAYRAITPKQRLDEMNPALKALSGTRLWAARRSAAMNFKEADAAPSALLNRILWWDAKGYPDRGRAISK
jgi:YVTN family beta-propeller protein